MISRNSLSTRNVRREVHEMDGPSIASHGLCGLALFLPSFNHSFPLNYVEFLFDISLSTIL